jgi:cytochrome c oxidase cbb3-type subunit 3
MRNRLSAQKAGGKLVLIVALLGYMDPAILRSQSESKQGNISEAPSPGSMVAGRKIFASSCSGCHGLDGHGGERAPDILVRPEVQRMSQAEIARVVREGAPSKMMPAFGSTLDAAQIRDVAIYLRSLLQSRKSSTALPGDPSAGRLLFFGKAACSDCHMAEGLGGFLGADLTDYAEPHSADEIRAAITNPAKGTARQEKVVSVATAGGDHFTGIARNEDNFSLQLQTPDGAFHLLMKSDLTQIEYPRQPLMPTDYSQKLNAGELNDLISFLMRTAAAHAKAEPSGARGRDPDED